MSKAAFFKNSFPEEPCRLENSGTYSESRSGDFSLHVVIGEEMFTS